MIEAEYLAFKILTFSSAHLSTTMLAAQSTVAKVSTTTFYVGFSLSITTSARIGNLICVVRTRAAQVSVKVTVSAAVMIGLFNLLLLLILRRFQIPRLFTKDDEVVELVVMALPLVAAFQLFDRLYDPL